MEDKDTKGESSCKSEATSGSQMQDDVYDFKKAGSNVAKESASVTEDKEVKSNTAAKDEKKTGVAAAEKRLHESSEDDAEEAKKKRPRREETCASGSSSSATSPSCVATATPPVSAAAAASAATPAAAAATPVANVKEPATPVTASGAAGKSARSTRGGSIEKNAAGSLSSGGGSSGSGKSASGNGKSRSSAASADRKSPVSATSSPKKPPSREHSDSDNDDENSKKSSDSSGLKVPPLKIVLSNQGNGNGNGVQANVASSAVAAGPAANAAYSSGTAVPDQDPAKRASSSSSAATSSRNASSHVAARDEAERKDMKGEDSTSAEDMHPSSNFSSATPSETNDGKSHSSTASRVTRSRANQGTPVPAEVTEGSANTNDGLQAASAPEAAASSSNASNGGSASGASSSGGANYGNVNSAGPLSSYTDYHVKKRKLRSQVNESLTSGGGVTTTSAGMASEPGNESSRIGGGAGSGSSGAGGGSSGVCGAGGIGGSGGNVRASSEPLNDIEKYLSIRRQVEQRRKNLFPVQPKPPQGFKDYLMNRKTYLLHENAHERLRSIPMIQPPASLDGPLRELFKAQEEDRYKLRMKHLVEKEKLVLAVEQEILRVHGRAARALANQSLPYSVCTFLRDEEIYTPIDPQQEEKNRDIRSRYNGRLFLSWLQDVDDKWEKIKEQMVLRHHNEAESLNAVQKMDWEWKVKELSLGKPGGSDILPPIDDLHIPMVHVSDDFDLDRS